LSGLAMSLVIRSAPTEPFIDATVCWAGAGVPPRRGRSLTFTQKGPQHHISGLAGRSAGEGLGRPAVVPPAGRGWGLDARPCRGAGGRKVGRFLRKRRGRVWTERTRSLSRGGRPSGPRRRVAAVGSNCLTVHSPCRWVGQEMDREDSFPTARWAAQRAAKAGRGRGRRVGGRRPSCECQ
jgi:hypothetical protein